MTGTIGLSSAMARVTTVTAATLESTATTCRLRSAQKRRPVEAGLDLGKHVGGH